MISAGAAAIWMLDEVCSAICVRVPPGGRVTGAYRIDGVTPVTAVSVETTTAKFPVSET